MISTLLRVLSRAYLGVDAALDRARLAGHGAATGFFCAALTTAERSSVTDAIYERAFRKAAGRRALAAWEIAWLSRRLPRPPARLLVGAAGDGVEVEHLVALGYSVDALEPSRSGARGTTSAGADTVCVARYEDLSRAVLDRAGGPAAALAERRYEAVLLGWGSLAHILAAGERQRIVRACDRLAPNGPILASFLLAGGAGAREGRAHALGRSLGRLVARGRGHAIESVDAGGSDSFGHWYGFAHLSTRDEIDALGREAGRRTLWENDGLSGYPHVTFEPPGAAAPVRDAGASS